ncbi:MAG: hypothetical protein ABSF10_14255 [Verrucomicrobiota bacterium]|jgi:hypothetical protein
MVEVGLLARPDPLPQEREKHWHACLMVRGILPPTPSSGLCFQHTSDLPEDGRRFSLSPGERAGVRASVPQNISVGNNPPKAHCDLVGLLIKTSIQLSHEIKVLAEFGASPEENLKPWIYPKLRS